MQMEKLAGHASQTFGSSSQKWEKTSLESLLACLLATWDGETKSPVRKGKTILPAQVRDETDFG